MHRLRLPFALLIAASLAGGCDDSESSPETLVDTPRLIAVKADPAVLGLTGASSLSALVVDASGERADVTVSYRACSPWRPVRSPDVDCGPGASLPLPDAVLDASQVVAAFPPPSEDIDLLGGMAEADDRCDAAYGFVELPIIAEAVVDRARLIAIKRVRVTLDELAAMRGNPAVESLLVDDQAASVQLPFDRAASYSMTVAVAEASLDEVCAEDAPSELALEELRINFYATAGWFTSAAIDAETALDGRTAIDSTTWTAPSGADTVTLWLVVTDQEGGVDWDRYQLSAVDDGRM